MKFFLTKLMTLEIIPVHIKKEINRGDKLSDLILSSAKQKIQDGDILVISQKIISKQEGRTINLTEVILSESKRIVRMENETIMVETNQGCDCVNTSGEESYQETGYATLLPL